MSPWFTADVTTLRRLLLAVDRRLHQTRLVSRLDDDERLDLLLEQLEKRAPDPAGEGPAGAARGSGGGNGKSRSGKTAGGGRAGGHASVDATGVAFDVQHIRRALGTVEGRLTDARASSAAAAGQTPAETAAAGRAAVTTADTRAAHQTAAEARDYTGAGGMKPGLGTESQRPRSAGGIENSGARARPPSVYPSAGPAASGVLSVRGQRPASARGAFR